MARKKLVPSTLEDGTIIDPIRIETALSRFPIHNLAKSEPLDIRLQNQGEAIRWYVAPNSMYGHPGPLAYKIDTLVINRRIDEARSSFGQAFPPILRLGSLREIAEEIGTGSRTEEGARIDGTKTNDIKRALLQNASAFITAKIEYTLKSGTKKTLDANFTRYQVVMKGETLPDDRVADTVYIVLNPIFLDIVANAQVRPVDYLYLKELKPLSQRFYEIVSPVVYGAVRYSTFTNIRYSEFCLLAPAVRQSEQWQMKKQLKPVITPHIESGYLSEVHYQPIMDEEGAPDWYITLTPGPLARGQADAFNLKRSPRTTITAGDPRQPTLPIPLPPPARGTGHGTKTLTLPLTLDPPEVVALIEDLKAQELNIADAERLAREKPEECRRQLDYLPYVREFTSTKGAYLRSAIEQGFAPPKSYQEEQAKAEAAKRRQEEAAARLARKAELEVRRAEETARVEQAMTDLASADPDAYAGFVAYVENEREKAQTRLRGFPERQRQRMLAQWDSAEKRQALFLLWKAEQEKRTTTLGLRLPADPADIDRKHLRSQTLETIITECSSYNAQRSPEQPEVSAYGLLDTWLQQIRQEGTLIADPDAAFTDFALRKIFG